MALHSCTFTIAQRTPLRVESIFDDAEEEAGRMQSPEPYEDPLDQLEFPESPSPGDDDYEPDGDDYQDDYDCEPDEDDDKVSEDGVYDHNASATPRPNGQKRARSNSMDADNNGEYERARKVVKSKGRPKASDYADDVQDILDSAITHYKVDLLRFDPYPGRTDELAWAKTSWGTANKVCDLKIAHNGELIKMVSSLKHGSYFAHILSRSHAVVPISVVKLRRRLNLSSPACMASRSPPMRPFALVTGN